MRAPKAEQTRLRILESASGLFAAKSFDSVSMRAIAKHAGVDAALVHHYFGTKDELFDAVLAHGAAPESLLGRVVAHPMEHWGEELVRAAMAAMDSPAGPALRAMLRSGISSHPELLRRFVTSRILRHVGEHLEGSAEERDTRGVLVGSQFVGLFVARYLVQVEPLASMPAEEVVRMVGPNVQHYLTGEL